MAKGWLEFGAEWLGAIFGLKATGKVRVDMETGKVLVEIDDPKIKEDGQVLEGIATTFQGPVTVPSGWRPKGSKRAPV